MSRKSREELQEIQKKYNVDRLWSWSRVNTYRTSPFEYFLRYVSEPKIEEDRVDSAYSPYGTLSHSILEIFYGKDIPYEKMAEEFEDGLFTLELVGLKFDRNNEEKNNAIREKYVYDLRHFFRHHNTIKHKVLTEKFVLAKVGGVVFQGYIDCVFKDADECFNIIDFKTSSMYKGEKVNKESGQLILYSLGLSQMGVPIEKIKAGWNFLKYCNVSVEQANGKTINRQIERCQIGKCLKSNCAMWLKRLGYADEAENYIDLLLKTNDISCLPNDIQRKYAFDDCYVFVEINDSTINRLAGDLNELVTEIKAKEHRYKESLDESIFYDDDESIEKASYYFSTLCGYSPRLHKPYGLYLDRLGGNGNFKQASATDRVASDLDWLDKL